MDFFNLLKLIKSPLADNWKHFATRYCDGRQITQHLKNGNKKKIWLTSGASNLEELAAKTKNLILRRLKKDVLDMPEKIITPMYYDLTESQWTEYNNLWEEYLIKRKELKKRGKVNKELTELIMLRKFVAMQAIPKTITLAEEAIEQGRKVIIFTNFTEELEVLQEHFDKICVIHNGAMSIKDKQKSVDRFQETAKIKVFIGNEKSAGVGITLTEATVVIFNSYDWVTGNNEQAEDRSYRIGQKNDVNIYYQLFIDTISIRMWETLKFKKSIINTILSEKSDDFDETEWLMEKLILDEES
jgi:SWI/SNF-related matrix-associated actin-dependent regulator 1 of chromatin subfamily A